MAADFQLPAWHTAAKSSRRRCSPLMLGSIVLTSIIFSTLILYTIANGAIARLTTSVCRAQSFTVPHTVAAHPEYLDLSPAGDAIWETLFTENGAFILRQTPTGPDGADEVRPYGISMFHQLHCLSMIRLQLQAMNMTIHGETLSTKGHHDLRSKHWLHCLDYLRQAILCNADDNIEAPQRHPSIPDRDYVNGDGQRMCRDSQKLYEWSRLSGPNLKARKKLLAQGETWPEVEGVDWPAPLD